MCKFPHEIKERLYSDFPNIYRAFSGFVGSGKLWDLCLQAIEDEVLMSHIIFCNDIHQIPPVQTFLKVMEANILELTGMENVPWELFGGLCLSLCSCMGAKRV